MVCLTLEQTSDIVDTTSHNHWRLEHLAPVIVRILPYFQEEMMVQEYPNKLEKKMIAWREEKKQIKKT